jgi:hypothetical protein
MEKLQIKMGILFIEVLKSVKKRKKDAIMLFYVNIKCEWMQS